MIERVATAIADHSLRVGARDWDHVDDHDRALARAAIEAMRDYCDEMALAVSNMNSPRTDNNYGRAAAALEAALESGK